VVIDIEHYLTVNCPDADANANASTCISAHKCPICYGIPRTPVFLSTCGHLFCEECIMHVAMLQPKEEDESEFDFNCPCCRALCYWRSQVVSYDKWPNMMRQVWALNRVKCQFCKIFQGSPFEVNMHERSKCARRSIRSSCGCCNFVGTVDEVLHFMLNCKNLLVCCFGCSYIVKFSAYEDHNCEEVKQRVSKLPPNSQRLIRKGYPGEFGDRFTWDVNEQLYMLNATCRYEDNKEAEAETVLTPTVTPTPTTSTHTTPSFTVSPSPTASTSATPSEQVQNPELNMETPTSSSVVASTPNAPQRRSRRRRRGRPNDLIYDD